MSLSEGKMFTIEALNRIEGFVWPEGAEFASLGCNTAYMAFWASVPSAGDKNFHSFLDEVYTRTEHPDWRNSLITREEFESVDGWVRNDGNEPVINGDFDLLLGDGEEISFSDLSVDSWDWSVPCEDGAPITHWRYHKPQKQEVKPEPESNASAKSESQDGIESLISKHKAAKEIARLARIELERVEAAEHSLMLSIEAWAESHGFDIRALSESEEK